MAATSVINQETGHAHTASATKMKYRTTNSGSPLSHQDVDDNFELLRQAVNGIIGDIDGGVDKNITSDLSNAQLGYSENNKNYPVELGKNTGESSSTRMYVNVPWVNTNTTYSAGSGLSLTGTVFSNSAPDRTVSLTGGTNVSVTGNYPNFTIASTDTNTTYGVAGNSLGLVKEGGDIDIDGSGNMTVKAGSITSTEIATSVNLSSSDWIDIKRFKSGYVGNKYQTTGVTIEGGDDNQDGYPEVATISAGIGGPTSRPDGVLTSGRYWVTVYYPGSTSNWYTNTLAFSDLQWRQIAVQNSWVIPHNSLHNASYITQNPPCYINSSGQAAGGSGSIKIINYRSGVGQSFCMSMNGNTTWIRCRSDGLVDLHLRSGNTHQWSYAVVTFLKYSNSND